MGNYYGEAMTPDNIPTDKALIERLLADADIHDAWQAFELGMPPPPAMSYDGTAKLEREAATALESALTSSDGWRTMESAPRDGTEILTTNDYNATRYIVSYHNNGWLITKPAGRDPNIYFHPTHWQPLPAPPAPSAADET